jgi:hypothetical protein
MISVDTNIMHLQFITSIIALQALANICTRQYNCSGQCDDVLHEVNMTVWI